jgi:nitroreductase
MKEILERRSIRKYTDSPISEMNIKELLRAAMSAPSGHNQQLWEFIVIKNKKIMKAIADFHPYAQMLRKAPLSIVVCGNLNKEEHADGWGSFWDQDCAAATENILIEAQHLGLGAVWISAYPREDIVTGLKKLLDLPKAVIPLSIIAIGHPAEKKEAYDRYDENKVHINKW